MSGIIYTGTNTKPAHGIFLKWLNGLLSNYVTGFYDGAISNIIELSFIRKHSLFMQELYTGNGSYMSCFMSVVPTDIVNPLIMIHSLDGIPVLYNDTDMSQLFEFDTDGVLVRFFENVTIDLKDPSGAVTHELSIKFQNPWGIKTPFVRVREKGTNLDKGTGILDVDYESRYSGSYEVETTPFNKQSFYHITNITVQDILADIPLLPNLAVKFRIRARRSVQVVATPLSKHFIETGLDLDALRYKYIDVNAEGAPQNYLFVWIEPNGDLNYTSSNLIMVNLSLAGNGDLLIDGQKAEQYALDNNLNLIFN